MNEMRPEGTTHDESYIGDSVTAKFNGWDITLSTPRPDGEHFIALEPEVFRNLIRFAERINAKYQLQHFATREAAVMREALE